MKVLVTGSEGFIGRHLVQELHARGDYVTAIDIKNGDHQDCRKFFAEVSDHYDAVIHLAALVGGREGIDFNAAMLGAWNAQLDGAMFEWALKTRPGRVVFFSSAASYPNRLQDRGVVHNLVESDINLEQFGMPDSTYGWQKLTGEVLGVAARIAGLKVSTVRPFSSYGEDQDDCYPFPQFVRRALARHGSGGSRFEVWGNGEQERDLIHIDDLVRAVLTMIDEGIDGPVNLGTGRSTSFNELAHVMCKAAGYVPAIYHRLDKPVGVHRRVSDNSLLKTFCEPRITLEEGCALALQSLAAHA
ncbi:MAG: NAD-dependent epimerase/dehydratase family protein [Cyanobacteria bacterium REEB65]|nr:NAD-dependent epimerase/dehydratase family protein [Cyanobacteria bacterium REEB65]